MFNRINARPDRKQNALGPVSMRSDHHSERMCLVDDRLQFLERVLPNAGIGTFAQGAAGNADLYYVCAVLTIFPNLCADRPGPIGDLQARSRNAVVIDGISQRNVGIPRCTKVSCRGKPREESFTRVDDPAYCLVGL